MIYLLDTNTCIAAMRGVQSVCDRLASVAPDDCAVSVVTIYELRTGVVRCAKPDQELAKVGEFLRPLHILPFDEASAEQAAAARWELEKIGMPIGPYDLLLAGQALALDLRLVTRNTSEFERLCGLKFESWQ